MSAKKTKASAKLPVHTGRKVNPVSTAKEAHDIAKQAAAEKAAKFPSVAEQRATLAKPWQAAAKSPAKTKKR